MPNVKSQYKEDLTPKQIPNLDLSISSLNVGLENSG